MSGNNTTRMSLAEARQRKGETDWDRLRKSEPAEDADDIEVDWTTVQIVGPEPKTMISLRVDRDVLEFFRRSGKGYQTRINAVLRAYKEAQERR